MAAISKLSQASMKHLESYDKCKLPTMTNAYSKSEYRTIIHFAIHSDTKVL